MSVGPFFSHRIVLGIATGLPLLACGSAPALPPAVGDCTPVADASCAEQFHAAGSVAGQPEGGAPSSEAAGTPVSDADICGLDMLSLAPSNPECLPCISQVSPNGCCGFASACSVDIYCPGRLACAQMGAVALATCVSPADLASSQLFSCLQTVCSPMCMDLVAGLATEQ
jgi:hypothetical protein